MDLRALDATDVPAALRLSEQAGWNQTAADWAYLLRAGTGFGITDAGGKLIATAIALPYAAGFGWISMVLVDRGARGSGLATRMLAACSGFLRERGCMPIVDATPAGRPIYAARGFRDAFGIKRLRGTLPAPFPQHAGAPTVRPVTASDIDAIVALDDAAFGASRRLLAHELLARRPELAFIAERGDRACGFVMGREGRTATQIGPVVAADATIASALVGAALPIAGVRVVLDVPDEQPLLQSALFAAGFSEERPFTRMLHESTIPIGRPEFVFATAGPELG
jgi:ribosomal protein S18 acetylase RimI-like enzyme